MIGHNKYGKGHIITTPPPKKKKKEKTKKLFYSKSLKTFKNYVFTTCFRLYCLTNEATRVHDSGACFIEYVFEFYFQ